MAEGTAVQDTATAMAEEAFEELKQGGQPAGQAEKGKGTMLPTKKTPPKVSLSDQTVLVHGRPKIGKSTLCAGAPDAVFIATEAGLNSLEVYQVPVQNWQEFLNVCREIAEGNHSFKTVVIDTLDNAFRMCSAFVCAKHKIEHESDLPYGKGFSFVYNEFYRVLNKLSLLPYGLYLICHSQEKEVETRTGKRTRIVPTLPDKARRMVLGMVDIILYCDVETTVGPDGKPAERRIMRTRPSENYEAGDRTGRLPEVVDLDYAKFVAAFDLPAAPSDSAAQAGGKAGREEKPAPPKPRKRQYATDAQVKEFDELTSALEIAPDVVKQRLAQLGAEEAYGVERQDMDNILAKLRAAAAKAGQDR